MTERTYTEQEMQLERAAWMREAAALPESLRKYIHDLETRCDPSGDVQTIASLKDQRDALEAEVAEVRAEIDSVLKRAIKCGDARRELELEVKRLRAETAALLEVAAAIGITWSMFCRNKILALIPADHAAALREHDEAVKIESFRDGHLEASTTFTEAIRAISPDQKNQWHQTWPPEEFIEAAFERYSAERIQQAVREEAEWWAQRGNACDNGECWKRLMDIRAVKNLGTI